MPAELQRSEISRLFRTTPLHRLVLIFDGGERVLLEHSEIIAFDPTPGGRLDVSTIGASLRYYGTLDALPTFAMLNDELPPAWGVQSVCNDLRIGLKRQ